MKKEQKHATFYLKRNKSQDLMRRDHQLELSHDSAWAVKAKAEMTNTQFKSVFLFNSPAPSDRESSLQNSTE